MAHGNGPKWIVTTAVVCLSLFALLFIGWVCLPVSRTGGPVHLYARPSGIGAQSFSLTVTNDSKSPRGFVNRPTVGSAALSTPAFYELDFVHPGEKEFRTVDPYAPPVYGYSGAYFSPGLHRTFIESVSARTDVWVFVFGGRIYAIK